MVYNKPCLICGKMVEIKDPRQLNEPVYCSVLCRIKSRLGKRQKNREHSPSRHMTIIDSKWLTEKGIKPRVHPPAVYTRIRTFKREKKDAK